MCGKNYLLKQTHFVPLEPKLWATNTENFGEKSRSQLHSFPAYTWNWRWGMVVVRRHYSVYSGLPISTQQHSFKLCITKIFANICQEKIPTVIWATQCFLPNTPDKRVLKFAFRMLPKGHEGSTARMWLHWEVADLHMKAWWKEVRSRGQ